MIKHIQDAISYGLYEGFWAEDSILVTGFHECFGEQLDCEAFSSWPDEKEAGVLHLALGEGKQFKISIEEEQTRQLDITPIESGVDNSYYFCVVNTSGGASRGDAGASLGVALGFCI